MNQSNLRIAWLLPSIDRGSYWHPVFAGFTEKFPKTEIFTGDWPGYAKGFEDAFKVNILGKHRFIQFKKNESGYDRGIMLPSFAILANLFNFKPDVVFTSAFSLWSLFAIVLKQYLKLKVIVAYEGSSPVVDYRGSKIRTFFRRMIAKKADAFVTNSKAGEQYLVEYLGVRNGIVFSYPYEVPSSFALMHTEIVSESESNFDSNTKRPVFLFVGQTILRKGIQFLIEACQILKSKGCTDYTILIVGDGEQRKKFQDQIFRNNLEENFKWVGWVDYNRLGHYFKNSDVFVFPSLEDTWGVVVLEAMAFGKPVLCSKLAGASELVLEGENGFVFNPYQPEEIASQMEFYMKDSAMIKKMGDRSREIMAAYTPENAVAHLCNVVQSLL